MDDPSTGQPAPHLSVPEVAALLGDYTARWSIDCDGSAWTATRRRPGEVTVTARPDVRELCARLAEIEAEDGQ